MPHSTEIIASPQALRQLADILSREPVVACDLEADSMHHYQEKVCLLQFSATAGTWLVDPLAIDDLSPLAPILADPATRKILHGADYDIRSLHRDFCIEVNNLFDTMVACQFLGEKEFGLAAVLRKRFGVELDKKFQRADWSCRPLSPEMVAYAAMDTTRLIELYRQLESELRAKGRLAWVEEECLLLSRVRMQPRGDEPFYLRFKGAARMAPRILAVLEEVLRYRDEKARLRDLPPFKVLDSEGIRHIAEKRPRTIAELSGLPGMTAKVLDRHGKGIIEAVARGFALPEAAMPSFPSKPRLKKSRREEELLANLKSWRESIARELEMEPGILANNTLLETLAGNAAKGEYNLDMAPSMRAWQKKEFGPELLSILRK